VRPPSARSVASPIIAVLSQARLRLESLDCGLGGGAEDTVPRPFSATGLLKVRARGSPLARARLPRGRDVNLEEAQAVLATARLASYAFVEASDALAQGLSVRLALHL
jgi:hypothetical protein